MDPHVVRLFDEIGGRFEAALNCGDSPEIRAHMLQVPKDCRTDLFRELLRIELVYRRRRGESPAPDEYLTQFSDHANIVREAFAVKDDLAQPAKEGRTNNVVPPRRLDDYEILDEISRGGMGVVYKAYHARMHRTVAVKIISPSLVNSHESEQRFQREVRTAAQLVHPNIVTAYDAGNVDGMYYLVMEYVEGCDLANLVKDRGPLGIEVAVNYIKQAARGLEYAHGQGIVHRDIKPANLLLTTGTETLQPTTAGTRRLVKILDMGLARANAKRDISVATADEDLTEAGQVMGTVDFMAPEQAEDTHLADQRSDIYSLGCSLYWVLAGRPPYSGSTMIKKILAHRDCPVPSLRNVRKDVPRSLDAVFQKMVAKDPNDRYQSTEAVLLDLEEVHSGLASASSELTSAPPLEATRSIASPSLRRTTFRPSFVHVMLSGLIVVAVMALFVSLRESFSGRSFAPESLAVILQAEAFTGNKASTVERLANSKRDVIVLDPMYDVQKKWRSNDLGKIRSGRLGRKVLAYISVGRAENYRPYWSPDWDRDHDGLPDDGAPDFLYSQLEGSSEEYWVRYWDLRWQDIVGKYIDEIVEQGFDGVWLSGLDASQYFEQRSGESNVKPPDGITFHTAMVELVARLAARSREKNNDFLLVPEGAWELLELPEFVDQIDGFAVSELLTRNEQLTPESDVEMASASLHRLENKPIFMIEYCSDPALKRRCMAYASRVGFILLLTSPRHDSLGQSGMTSVEDSKD